MQFGSGEEGVGIMTIHYTKDLLSLLFVGFCLDFNIVKTGKARAWKWDRPRSCQ